MNDTQKQQAIEKLIKREVEQHNMYDLNYLASLEGELLFSGEKMLPEGYAFVKWLEKLTDNNPCFATAYTRLNALLRSFNMWVEED